MHLITTCLWGIASGVIPFVSGVLLAIIAACKYANWGRDSPAGNMAIVDGHIPFCITLLGTDLLGTLWIWHTAPTGTGILLLCCIGIGSKLAAYALTIYILLH